MPANTIEITEGLGVEVGTRLVGTTNYQKVDRAPVETATLSNVDDSTSSVTLAAANADRLGLIVYNDSSGDLYLKFGSSASSTSFTVKIPADSYWEMPEPVYTGIVTGAWSTDAGGAARVTELT